MRTIARTAAALAAGVALAFSAIAGTALPAGATSGCEARFASYDAIEVSATGSKVRAVECLLTKGGYAVEADGTFSAADSASLKKFQTSVGLPANGVVSRPTWTALIAQGSKPTLHRGHRSSTVKRLQLALRSSGYGKLNGTGYYGPATSAAVKALQKFQGWRQTGTTTAGVWKALQAGGATKVKVTTAKKTTTKKSTSTSKGAKALRFAKKQLGDSYRYGAQGPNAWDCSGLTKGSWKAAGVKLPRTSQAQYHVGKKVSKSHLRKGDLVFFYSGRSHVAIYAGNGKVIHASRPGKPVAYIKMKYMPYAGARRPA
jgi:cell wall-associated NlpC family hydrolase